MPAPHITKFCACIHLSETAGAATIRRGFSEQKMRMLVSPIECIFPTTSHMLPVGKR